MQHTDCCSTRVIQPTYLKQSQICSFIPEEELRVKAITCVISGFVINRRIRKFARLKETSAIMFILNVMRSCGEDLFKFQTD